MEWLLGVVNHLPSEDLCQKCLVAPVDDKEKHDDMMLGRTKCYDLVTKVCYICCGSILSLVYILFPPFFFPFVMYDNVFKTKENVI